MTDQDAKCVWVIGESIMDVVVDRDGLHSFAPGGSPANVAFGLGRLGVTTALTTALAADEYGARIETRLTSAGVALAGTSRLSRTATAIATIDPTGAAEYSFDIDWVLAPERPPVLASHIHIGSVSAFLKPGASTMRNWLDDTGDDVTISFDPNIRPAIIPRHPESLAVFTSLAARSDVVKLSDEDAAWLYPGLSLADVADTLLIAGAPAVIVTAGGDGATVWTGSGEHQVAAVPSTVVDTVGAGDSFMSGLLGGMLAGGMSIVDAASVGARCAAVTVSRRGSDPPTLADIGFRWNTPT